MKKVKSIFVMLTFCASLSFVSNLKEKPLNGDMMVGIQYAMAEAGESSEFQAAVGAVGTVATAALATGPVGWGFAIVAGL